MKASYNPIELWKAIHGGCWPGPPVDARFSEQVNDVIAGLALLNMASTFSDARVAQQARTLAVAGLNIALPALQRTVNQQGGVRATRARRATKARAQGMPQISRGLMPA